MTWPRGERLYHRLPELYRRRDLEQGEPLRALLAVAESQLELLEDDVAGLYENWFLETCQDWVVPYLADLLGIGTLGRPPHAGAHPRVQVGRVFDYRRRKGTPVVLERVTRDVTGWFARVVELFEFLTHTQNVGRVRPGRGGLFDPRRPEAVARLEDPFAPPELFHTVDVRRIASLRGRFNVPNLALYVWRLQSFSIEDGPAAPAAGVPGGFSFDPLGRDVQLFNRPVTPEEVVRRSDEHHLPVPLRPEILRESLEALEGYYGSARAFEVRENGTPKPPDRIVVADLAAWTAPAPAPAAGQVAVDPRLGRILFGTAPTGAVRVTFAYGFAAEMGGGPYDRRATLADSATAGFYQEVSQTGSGTPLADAVAAWEADSSALGVIRVLDSDVYRDDVVIDLAPGRTLVLEAADGARPVLIPSTFRVLGAGPGSGLTINGFLIDAGLEIEGSLDLQVTHTTLVPQPGRGSLAHVLGDSADLDVRVTFSIVGPLRLPENVASLRLEDSILDAVTAGTGASPLPVLVSGPLTDPLSLSTRLEVSATLDGEAPRTVRLQGVPGSPAQAAQILQDALRAAGAVAPVSARFTNAQAVAVGGRLLVRSGTAGEAVSFGPTAADAHTVEDLELTAPPARFATGLLSGGLAPFPAFGTLQVRVTLGGDGPYVAKLAGVPADLDEAAALLQQAVRAARNQPVFTQAAVVRLDDRLLVRPGASGAAVAFAETATDPQTVFDFGLDPAVSRRVEGVFSGFFDAATPFPTFPGPEVRVTIDGDTRTAVLDGPLATAADAASTLQVAIRAAAALPRFAGARVDLLGSRLLVRPGVAGEPVSFAASAGDTQTAGDLALLAPPGETIADGRLSTPLSSFPDFLLRLRITIGGVQRDVVLLHLPDSLGTAQKELQDAIRAAGSGGDAFQAAEVLLLGSQLLVRSDGASVTAQADPADASTAADLKLVVPPAESLPEGLLSSPIEGSFPVFRLPSAGISFGGRAVQTAAFTGFPRSLAEAGQLLQAALRSAGTGPSFTGAAVAVSGDRLMVTSGVPAEDVKLSPTANDPLTVADLGLVSPPAQIQKGLLSGELFPFPVLFRPGLQATIGPIGPQPVVVDHVPADLAEAGDLLEAALRAAHTNVRFGASSVDIVGTRLLVRPGIAGDTVSFQAAASDPNTVEDLALLQPPARRVRGLLSGTPAAFPAFSRPQAQVTMTVSGVPDGPHTATLAGLPMDLDQARPMLEAAIRASRPAAAFTSATVVRVGNRLVVQPGVAGALVTVAAASPADSTTAAELGLVQPPAVQALLSGDLATFPSLAGAPAVSATLAGVGPRTASFGSVPATLADARTALEAALRATLPADPAFTGATVQVLGSRLLVQAGGAGGSVSIADAGGSPTTATDLKLTVAAGGLAGLVSGDLPGFSGLTIAPRIAATLGATSATARFSDVPDDLAEAASFLQAALRAASPAATFTGALVEVLDTGLLVTPGVAGDTVAFADPASGPPAADRLALTAGRGAVSLDGLLSGDTSPFGITIPPLAVTATFGTATRTVDLGGVPTGVADLAVRLQAALRAGTSLATFTSAAVLTVDSRILVLPGNPMDRAGFTAAPASPDVVTRLELDAAASTPVSGLLSGPLAPFQGLRMEPAVEVTIGTQGPLRVLLGVPHDLAEAGLLLEAGLRRNATDPTTARPATFLGARVRLLGNRLLVTGGTAADAVVIQDPSKGPATATLLGLAPGLATDAAGLLGAPPSAPLVPVSGLLSGSLSPFPTLSANPAVAVTVGTEGPYDVRFAPVPASLEEARALLEAAIRQAHAGDPFTRARVVASGNQLFVIPGVPGAAVKIENVSGGPATATQLGLAAAAGGATASVPLPGTPGPFTGMTLVPRLTATFGTGATAVTHTVSLADLPLDISGARDLLERALRAAGDSAPASSRFTGATVRVLGNRLLVRAGGGGAVAFTDAATGAPAASRLGLAPGEAGDGFLSGSLDGFTGLLTSLPAIDVTLAGQGPYRATLAHAPVSLADARSTLQAALRSAHDSDTFQQATVVIETTADEVAPPRHRDRLLITPGNPQDSISLAPAAGREGDLARLELDPLKLVPAGGLLSGGLSAFSPRTLPELALTHGASTWTVSLSGFPVDLASAAALLQQALRGLGPFAGATVEAVDDRLLVSLGVAGAFSFAPTAADPLTAARLRLDTAQAVAAGGLLSGDLSDFPRFAGSPALLVQIGDEGPYRAALPSIPADVAGARTAVEAAIRAAHNTAAFTLARVALTSPESGGERRLVLLPGRPGRVVVTPPAEDPNTAGELKLTGTGILHVRALLSGSLESTVSLPASPSLHVAFQSATTTGEDFDAALPVSGGPLALPAAASALQTAIRGTGTSLAADQAWVAQAGTANRLVAVPGADGSSIGLSAAAGDPETVGRLGFEVGRAVGTGLTDQEPGPALQLERVTVFGHVFIRELPHASEVLFNDPVRVERRNVGCVRYSYLPDGSETPRRFRCQPDLALALAIRRAFDERARELGLSSAAGLSAEDRDAILGRERTRVLARLVPRFTSTRFGDPGYAQISAATALELLTGAEDGSEMGAFSRLQEPLRRSQLATLIDEYLRFGLDAGIFYVT